MALAEDITHVAAARVKMHPDELAPEARTALARILQMLLQIECNKQQVKEVYVHFPTPEENKEAARERGLQGRRIEEVAAILKAIGTDPNPGIATGLKSLDGTDHRPAMFRTVVGDWDDFLIFRYLRDRAQASWAIGFLGTDYVPFAVTVSRLFMHTALGSQRPTEYCDWADHQTRRMRERLDKGLKDKLQASLDRWYPLAVALAADTTDEASELAAGIRGRAAVVGEKVFVTKVSEELGALGLSVPDSLDRFAGQDMPTIYLDGRADLPDAYRAKLVKLLKMHLSSEYTTTYLEALDPPTAEDIAEWSHTIQEEGEHGEGMVDLLRNLGEDAQAVIDDMRYGEGAYLLDFFKIEIESWDEIGIMRWLSERAAGYQSLASLGSNYIPYALWSARNYMDEGMAHAGVGKEIIRRAIDEGRMVEVQRLFNKRYPSVIDYFGSEKPGNEFIDLGIKVRSNAELRRRWLKDQILDCAELGVQMPGDPLKGDRMHY
ncbi:MAG: phenylacetate-CoA oxygenase subunit PaaI [Proteobacteria bacterium]|nr:phenylacetate-CoA oxygenase subunit PaaI [Pseudomonadota bacterium]MDA1057769.1 phenylacetate-CoA oxygenase subunit PaaI [Pseudomonadota bacterium]